MSDDMFKKRAMAKAKWVDDVDSFTTVKSLETGYAGSQPRYPYWVQPRNYSYTEWDDMRDWMIDTMGHSDWVVKHARWVGSDRKYWFRDERDRTMFILRWS